MSHIECDGGPACMAITHIDGCYATERRRRSIEEWALLEANLRLREALERIASCESVGEGDVVDIARKTLEAGRR